MTTEELLKPRFEVIADYPGSPYKIGDIKQCAESEHGDVNFYRQYTNIFKKLEWWEGRHIEDMPEYLKEECTGEVIKTEWRWNERLEIEGRNIESKEWYETDIATLDSLPATKEEYEQYLKTKQQ